VYEEDINDLFVTYRQVAELPEQKDLSPEWLGKPIPLDMWKEILAFMKQSQDKFKSEALAFLYYDVSNDDNPWSYWVPPQETAGMTVKSLPDDSLWREQRSKYPDTQFGTVHHHCTSSAFQSGTDEADEVNREGLHFTIGKLNDVDNLDVHFRLSIGGHCVEMNAGTYIEQAESPFKATCRVTDSVQDQVRNHLHKIDIATLPDGWEDMDFTVQMDNVHKKTYSVTSYSGYSKHKTMHQGTLGYAYGYDPDDKYFKKNTNEAEDMAPIEQLSPSENLAEDFITAIMTDYRYEEILEQYYIHTNNSIDKTALLTGTLVDTQICNDLCNMFRDNEFMYTAEYKNVETTVDEFLKESSQFGLAYTQKDLINGLQSLNNAEGIGVEYMDKENVL
jgi:hypothetical protein